MSNRRGRGEGSVFKRRTGVWVARLDLEYQGGRRKRKEFQAATQRAVQEWLAQAKRRTHDNLPIPDGRYRVGMFLTAWLRDVAEPSVKVSTYTRYRELIDLHVMPTLSTRVLTRLAPDDLQTLYAQKLAEGLSPRTVGHIHRVLHRAFADAVAWGKLGRNPCDAVRPPMVKQKEMNVLTPEQTRRLLAAAEGDPLEALYYLAVSGGLRQGEILALRWSDIDLDRRIVQVRRTIRAVVGRGFMEWEPKSERSKRSVKLIEGAVSALQRHRVRQAEQRLLASSWGDEDRVFTNSVGRPILPGNLIRRSFRPLLNRAGLPPVRFHDLRHGAATLLLSEGVPAKVVSEMLGHASVALTLDVYSHVTESMQQQAADAMARVLATP